MQATPTCKSAWGPSQVLQHGTRESKIQNPEIRISPGGRSVLDTREGEVGERGPVAQPRGVTADAHPLGERRRWPVEHEQLVPARRRDLRVWRRGDRAGVQDACELREDRAAAHRVAVGRGRGCSGMTGLASSYRR